MNKGEWYIGNVNLCACPVHVGWGGGERGRERACLGTETGTARAEGVERHSLPPAQQPASPSMRGQPQQRAITNGVPQGQPCNADEHIGMDGGCGRGGVATNTCLAGSVAIKGLQARPQLPHDDTKGVLGQGYHGRTGSGEEGAGQRCGEGWDWSKSAVGVEADV